MLPCLVRDQYRPPHQKESHANTFKSLDSRLRLVDVGTGSGGWVLEVADEYPGAKVYGIDISAIQPTFVPGNAEFIVMDLTNGLDFDDGSTDFVHSRCPIVKATT